MRTNGDARRHAGIGGRRAEAWRPFPSRRWGRQPPRSALIQASSPSPELAQVIITMHFFTVSQTQQGFIRKLRTLNLNPYNVEAWL